MSEFLTMAEIEARYAPDWVLLGDIETDDSHNVLRGRVLFHSPNRDEVWDKSEEFPPGRYAVFFLGTCPEDMEFVL